METRDEAKATGIELQVVKRPEASKRFVRLQVLAELNSLAFAMLMASKVTAFFALGEPAISQ